MLFLIYINDLPNCLRSASANLFADDTNISLSARNVHELEPLINSELANLKTWLIANKLSWNIAKIEFMVISSWQKRLADGQSKMCIQIDDKMIKQSGHTKSLGLTIDDRLSWSKDVHDLCKKILSDIGALKKIIPYILKNYLFTHCCANLQGV